jgi:hypothetical protein
MSFQPRLRPVANIAFAFAFVVGLAAGHPAQAQPRLTVDPPTLTAALANGESGVRQLTIGNAGTTDLHWSTTMVFGGLPSTPVTPAPRILLMTDTPALADPHIAALDRLNLAYTSADSWFWLWLQVQYLGTWDLVIVSNRTTEPDPQALEALAAHLDRGGALLYADAEPVAANPLLARLGITPAGSLAETPELVPAGEPHRCFTWPNRIDGFAPQAGSAGDAGVQIVSASGHARSLASFAGQPGSGAVVVNARRRALYNAFHAESFLGDADADGVRDAVELAENEITYLTMASSWVAVEPSSGVVPAGGSQVVNVGFEMSTSCVGALTARIRLASDDPDTPNLELTARLTRVPEKRLTSVAEPLDFGTQYIGAVVPRTFRILNDGCASLAITGVTVDHPAFRIATSSPFTAWARSANDIVVEFAPTSLEPVAGTVTLTSDDSLVPVVTVALTGAGRVAPAVVVQADSLTVALAPGETATRRLSISNSGLADLEWSLAPGSAVKAAASEEVDLTGVRILWTRAHDEEDASSRCSTLVADLRARGAAVTVSASPITEGLLAPYHVLCVRVGWREWTAAEAAVLRQWIRNGGSLLLDGYDRYVMSAIPEGIGGGFTFVPVGQSQGLSTAIHPHPATAGITSLNLYWMHNSLVVNSPATTLADGPDGLPVVVADEIRSGRVIAIATSHTFDNWNLPEADNRPFALQVFDWLAGPRWLRATPTEGVLAPGDAREVTIDLDATMRCGVTLQQTLTIATNDPLQPTIALPVELTVSGNRLLVAMADSLDFGWLYTSQARTDTLLLRNDGCEPLTVSSLATGHEAFTATTPVPFTIAPDGAATVAVTFAPTAPGFMTATLVIDSDDSRGHSASVRLGGLGVPPPVATTAPSVLAVTLEPGETATRTLTLANTGQSDLDWKVGFRPDVATRPTTLPAPTPSAATGELPAEALSLTAELRDLTGMRIHWDVSHGQYLPGNWPTVVSDLLVRGATVEFNSLPLTPDRLDPMDVLWIIDTADTWQEAEIRAVADWVHNGGGLLLEGDDDVSVGVFNRILAAAGFTFRYGASDAQAGFTTIIHEHPATVDIASIHLSDPAARLTGVDLPARRLVDDPQGVTVAAASEAGAGRVVAVSEEMFNVWSVFYGDNRRFGNKVFDWLAVPRWVRVFPLLGVLPPGGSEDLAVNFTAAHTQPGLYTGRLEFVSNDPATPMLRVPLSLNVGGVPDLPRIVISAATGKLFAAPLDAGAAAGATDGFDPGLDLSAPDPCPAGLAAWFAHPEWNAAPGDRFLADLRAPFDPAASNREWRFLVASDHAAPVTLEFAYNVPGLTAHGLQLVDMVTGATTNLHAAHTYVYSAGAGVREFRLRLGGGLPEPVPGGALPPAASWRLVLRLTGGVAQFEMSGLGGGSGAAPAFAVHVADPASPVVTLSWDATTLPPGLDFGLWRDGALLAPSLRAQDRVDVAVGDVPTELYLANAGSLAQASLPSAGPDLRNRPNPFNPSTEVSFNLERAGVVSVLVYDLRGVLVRTLDAGNLAAGPAVVVWNGLDQRGLEAASGTYVVRLTQDGRQLGPSRKMVLLK